MRGLRAGETLTVQAGGNLGNDFTTTGATLNIEAGSIGNSAQVVASEINISGGTIGNDFDAFASEVNISGGTIDEFFNAFAGSTVNISGGTVGTSFNAFEGSTVNISGGQVGGFFEAFNGSTVNISGGTVGNGFRALNGSTVDISGGQIGNAFQALGGSTVNISGGEFLLNGIAVNDISSPLTLSFGDVFTGTLEDGSSFLFSADFSNSDRLNGINLIETSTPTVNITTQTIDTASTLGGISPAQTLTVEAGGVLGDDFTCLLYTSPSPRD